MAVGGIIFGMGLTGYLKLPAEFELEMKRTFSIGHVTESIADNLDYTDDEISDMREKLLATGNNTTSPPDDWPYDISPVDIYRIAEEQEIPTPVHPVTTESQKVWMAIGVVLLAFSSIFPLLNSRAVALPMLIAVMMGSFVFTYGFRSFGANSYNPVSESIDSDS